MPAPIMCGSSIMWVSRIRNTDRCRASTLSSRRQTSRPAGGVAPDEGLEGIGEHVPGQPGHLDDLGFRGDRPGLGQPLGRLGDVDRVVADPLEVVGDLERRGQHPEVASHRLLQGQQVDALLLDLDLHAVDDPVARR